MSAKQTAESFWLKTMYAGDCIVFTGRLNEDGYGGVRFHGREMKAHRLAWELSVGKIPEGFEIDHICRNRACVNPGHLQCLDGVSHARMGYGKMKKHCQPGCEIRRDRSGLAYCITCIRKSNRVRRKISPALWRLP